MDAPRAREQLRRRYLFPPDTEASLDSEGYARPETSTAVEKKEKPLPRLNIHSGFWILASIVVTYYVDFFKTVKENFHTSRKLLVVRMCTEALINTTTEITILDAQAPLRPTQPEFGSWFVVGSALLLLSLSIACYCILYLEWCRGIEDYDVRYPTLIPVTTAAFLAAGICFNVALWHVWSFLTPLVLFTQFMGVVMLISLLG